MEDITLEKVDMVCERTGVGYEKAKEALEMCEGDVLEALIYIEKNKDINEDDKAYTYDEEGKAPISKEELRLFLKDLIEKGNVTRIKVKKDGAELADIPVNAGIAAGVLGIIIPQILAAVFIAVIATKITIEITKEDGSVEVVNKYVSKVADDVKIKATNYADKVKNKIMEIRSETKNNDKDLNKKADATGENVYSYTVKFDEEKQN